jgi:hypothetical protein
MDFPPDLTNLTDRELWLSVLERLAGPVLLNLSERRLRQAMPVEVAAEVADDRAAYTHLEAFGRLMAGMAPWLEVDLPEGAEAGLQQTMRGMAQRALDAATDPASPDFLNFHQGQQCLVDAAFLAQAIVRAPRVLWDELEPGVKHNLRQALRSTRAIRPFYNNWLLFSGMIEAALCRMDADWDQMRVDYALRQMDQWYKGDGAYGDGPEFHWDYYNSFVIHPMLLDILRVVNNQRPAFETFYVSHAAPGWADLYDLELPRARRYAQVLERMIGPDGAFPPLGRSLAYRFGAFHLLGQMALLHLLPPDLPPAQVRCALTAALRRSAFAPGTFDEQGWLRIGLCGHQPSIGEHYISTGSLYLCTVGLLPLGLPPEDEFWQSAPRDWTARMAWGGQDLPVDHAL